MRTVVRSRHERRVERLLREFPVVAILGARQIGKSTLARRIAARRRGPTTYFDLEDRADLGQLADPGLALRGLRGLVVLDEIHRLPEVFPLLRVLADRRPVRARFLVLGSATPELLQQSSETLAGRIAYHVLDGFVLDEVDDVDRLWLRGGFPLSFLAKSGPASFEWRSSFIDTFLARDVAEFGIGVAPDAMRRFWMMLAHYHGQVWNASEFARSFGVGHMTVRRYLDALSSVFVVRQLLPWHENLRKRQVKSPKVFVADSGLLHALLGLRTRQELLAHPKVGASWEGFVLSQVVSRLGAQPHECCHWATHAGAELDLLVVRGNRRFGFEAKLTEAPTVTKSMRIAIEDLGLSRLVVIHAGETRFHLAENILAVPATRIVDELRPMPG
jgi:predicted AAA+ superfamily ATPase